MRLYNYLFYKLYKEAIYIRKGGFPEKRAIMSLTLLLVSNFYFLLQIFYLAIDYNNKIIRTAAIALITLSLYIMNVILFLNDNKYKLIVNEFSEENRRQRIWGNIFSTIYQIISIGLLFLGKYLKDTM